MPLETAAAGDWFLSFVARVEREYPSRVVPLLAAAAASAGDDATVRACDEACVRALLLRLQFAAQVAASKARAPDARLREAARAGDAAALHARIVYPEVEQAVIARARGHADGFAKRRRLAEGQAGRLGEALAAVYRDWLIPLSREVQVAWLLAHAARVGRQRPA
jgi:chorismate mutase